jgi:glycosyltransferase involved in cell wall biosynthesis
LARDGNLKHEGFYRPRKKISKMKILQMSRWFFPHVGGAAIRVYHTAKNLTESGHTVHILTHNPKSIDQCNLDVDFPEYAMLPEGFDVTRLPYYPCGKSLNWAISIPLMAMKAVKMIKEKEIDVILSHNPPYLVGISSLIASKLTGVPMAVEIHDVWGAAHYTPLQYAFGNFLQSVSLKAGSAFVTTSEGARDFVSKEFGICNDKIFVSQAGIDFNIFRTSGEGEKRILKRYKKQGVERRGRYIFFVGIMREWAGVQYLIRAFAEIADKKELSDVRLLLVGGGGDLESFKKLANELGIGDRTIFTDSVPYEDVPHLMSLATIACAPFPYHKVTEKDLSPHKMVEYLAIGKPIVASAIPGMDKYIKDGESGLLFEPGDTKGLAEKFVYLLKNPKVMKKLSKGAYENAREGGFEWKDSVRSVEKALNTALKRK